MLYKPINTQIVYMVQFKQHRAEFHVKLNLNMRAMTAQNTPYDAIGVTFPTQSHSLFSHATRALVLIQL